MKNILVVSGSGSATAHKVAEALEEKLLKRSLSALIEVAELKDFDEKVKEADVVVSTMFLDMEKYKLPIYNGMRFLTGVGAEAETDRIAAHL